ncbi:hypothetical protein IEO70_02230 [Bacillus sp. AGMB 02131]|uniref:Uncharacterized protein n=1 Tax=Peribacillus faecalis TaxID=2772559 RepID=A0A927CWD5_9BACI|nr:hypothetical protein [Peribacillus faecalis]MBD3107185.1 hypothetical protein [Peribacillus faecalis]
MNKLEMVNMKKLMDNTEALEHLYLVSPSQCTMIQEVAEALKILSKEFDREVEGKVIENDEKLQVMTLEYFKACRNAEEIFSNAVKCCELTGFKF